MAEKPEDLNLPTAVITRIIKDALPDAVNISKEARAAISKAASVFVLYATSSANNFAIKSKRKTLTGQDVLAAMQDMEFEKFVEPLTECLETFKKEQKGKKEASDKRKKSKGTATKKSDDKKKDKDTESLEEDAKPVEDQPDDES
uniref:DNA polymerase epsilon subunit 3 n=1 Tax=Strigamia maritima TaxID=126957 RepID=T1JJN7_STRMM